VGANTAMFTVVNGVLLRPLPLHEPDQLLLRRLQHTGHGTSGEPRLRDANYLPFRAATRAFASLAAFNGSAMTLTGAGSPFASRPSRSRPDFFKWLGVLRQRLGRASPPPTSEANGGAHIVGVGQPPLATTAFTGATARLSRRTVNARVARLTSWRASPEPRYSTSQAARNSGCPVEVSAFTGALRVWMRPTVGRFGGGVSPAQ
jgi:hypothetical protein